MNDKLFRVNIERDLNEIVKLIDRYMHRTYMEEIEKEIDNCRRKCEKQACKEVQLINALLAFMPPEKQKELMGINQLIEYNQIIREMMPKLIEKDTRQEGTTEQRFKESITMLLLYKILSNYKKS